jgi:ribosomal protein L37AE/L43A
MEIKDSKWQPKVNGQPAEAHQRRPDPDEPWRYLCPDCEMHRLDNLSKGTVYCNNCKQRYDMSELIDKKDDPFS